MKMFARIAAIAAVAAALSGCMANQMTTAPGPFTGFSSDPMHKIYVHSSSFHVTARQYRLLQIAAQKSNEEIDLQNSDPIDSEGSLGGAYGAAYAGSGAMQGIAYNGIAPGAPALVGGMTGLLGGAVNGAQSWSYSDIEGTGSATETTLRDWEKYPQTIPAEAKKEFPDIATLVIGLHAIPATTGSKNRLNQPAKGLVQDWDGPLAGSPVTK